MSISTKSEMKIDDQIASCPIDEEWISELCKSEIKRIFGVKPKFKIDHLRLIHGYVFSIDLQFRCRKLARRLGGGHGTNSAALTEDAVWSCIEESRPGNFEVPIEGTSRQETCHLCEGSGICEECEGDRKVECEDCGGTGKSRCSHCGGSGFESCPNCRGSGNVRTRYFVNCGSCHGSGIQSFGIDAGQVSCPYCHGTGQEERFDDDRCPTCGGDGRATCKRCQGSGRFGTCSSCKGKGEVTCNECGGTGKCKECKGIGKTTYSWWCVQKELSFSPCRILFDNDIAVSSYAKTKVEKYWKDRCGKEWTIRDWTTSKSDCEAESLGEMYAGVSLGHAKSDNATAVGDVFADIWKNRMSDVATEIAKEAGSGCDYKLINQRYKITKFPVLAKCSISMLGKTGVIYIDVIKRDIVLREISKIQDACAAEKRKNAQRYTMLSWDIYLALALATVGLPYLLGDWSASEYLRTITKTPLLVGIVAYLAIDYVVWYFYAYVGHLAYREYGEWRLSRNDDNYKQRFVRLLWLLVPVTLCLGLYDHKEITVIGKMAVPIIEWFGQISESAWSYIAVICTIKIVLGIIARKYEWKITHWRIAITVLAVTALALAIWPVYLQDGVWLQASAASVLSVIDKPIRYLGLAIVWPLKICLYILGCLCTLVGTIVISIVLWIIHFFA